MTTLLALPESVKPKLSSDELNEIQKEARFFLAGKLYDMGKISQSTGAEMAGMDRIDFLYKLGQYGFCAINIQGEQIQVELDAIREYAKEIANGKR